MNYDVLLLPGLLVGAGGRVWGGIIIAIRYGVVR